ncbi:hypothetical protein [Mesorhizobium sp.]|uniref:hypothetical protein n=1 Tax=Mesorhizobium sp. TaxID=1871066 RepID=UPI00257ACF02|nr:hypothetical protein [Mesorhizobium sp.]
MLRLIKLWLKAPVEERYGDGKRHMSGGRRAKCGTPQGGVASPLLSVIYMNRFLKLPIPMKPPLCSEMIAPPVSGMISPPV